MFNVLGLPVKPISIIALKNLRLEFLIRVYNDSSEFLINV